MSLRVNLISRNTTLHLYITASRSIEHRVRKYATGAQSKVQNVAILGGGVTGLAAAFELLQNTPHKITIFDSKPKLGGWVQSEFVNVPGGKVLLEKAVRTLRPKGASGSVTVMTLTELGLENEVLICPADSPAAKNRYIYYPDHLVRLPSSLFPLSDLQAFLKEPLAEGLLKGLLYDFMTTNKAIKPGPDGYLDASVGEVLSARFGPEVANIASAGLHGIYAGSVDQLGFGALFPGMRRGLARNGSLSRTMFMDAMRVLFTRERKVEADDLHWTLQTAECIEKHIERNDARDDTQGSRPVLSSILKSSVFSFKGGVQQFTDKLVEVLRKSNRVTVKTNHSISSIEVRPGQYEPMLIKTNKEKRDHRFTHVISAMPGSSLSDILGRSPQKAEARIPAIQELLTRVGSVTVMVVNLWYPTPDLLPVKGFGYLIPRHVPAEQNPELGLGVVFDSEAIKGQDTVPGTKLTVMLGGHYWDGFDASMLPSEAEGISKAKSLVARHLGITDEPHIAKASMHKDCIPQYPPFHWSNMSRLGSLLVERSYFDSKLILAGASYEGVGLNDCVRSGRAAAKAVDEGHPGLMRVCNSVNKRISIPILRPQKP